MNFRTLTTKAYNQLHDLIDGGDDASAKFLGYDYSATAQDFVYNWQEQDFTRELANAFNQYIYWVERLTLWEEVFKTYSEDEVQELRMEFTALPMNYCLSTPYMFKSRLAYCATQLSYVNGLRLKRITKEAVRQEDKIGVGSLAEIAKHWSEAAKLVDLLKSIDGDSFREATRNYRNLSQHRHPQRIDFGHTVEVNRVFPEDAWVRYEIGEKPPLSTVELLPALSVEGDRMREAFNAYRHLVRQQSEATHVDPPEHQPPA